ncbi:metal tolerance protein 2 isoform X2 [Sorghum bicolor]|uniref:metal tolerance protein 2 isoform X2 n=1 Tax=Sorghum bicolor TaxID=4558 RepID=UPI000B425933|nr:metal tolerance protein 2 isoform X2 [Sorghum bicolor]|eukprot:XP_002467866.2 metal tolerance protein 2 isoform X2 [Sorghum bicolor]
MGFRFARLAARAAASRRGMTPAASARRALAPPALPAESRCGPHWLVPARGHVGHSHHHGGEDGGETSERIFRLGLAADVVLTVGKAVTGYLSGSTAIAADAAHSLSDIVLSGVALLSYRAAKAPRDKEHPYGHGKFESLGALGISSMLLVTSGGIAWHAFEVLQGVMSSAPDIIGNTLHAHHDHGSSGHHHGIDLEHPVLALSMTTLAISIKEGLYWITKRAGEKEGSGLMKANAWHHRADAISSVVALVGVGGSILGLPLLDPLAGLVVSGMILKAGIQTGYESVMELVDAAVDPSLLEPIKETILRVHGVKGCHRLRGRKAGTSLYLDVHIEVYPFLSVSAAHDIGETVRHQIQKEHNQVAEVFIHIDPSYSVGLSMDLKRNMKNSDGTNSEAIPRQQSAEAIVSNIISSHFSKLLFNGAFGSEGRLAWTHRRRLLETC